jgi:hypothetical protein
MSQENIEVVQRFVERFNAGEFAWDQLDPGVVWIVDPPAFLAGTYHGHDGVRTFLGRFTDSSTRRATRSMSCSTPAIRS